ncbi:hypothetical protein CONPUDRAFT_169105 [Coniophora puteana RWD-64-598 SS2]|uniref:DUF6534 domain-containing protein n=1 Tax=Coniophora puteana (strain RWD-64-598) TaxID=741705 RepID=A0A5M3M994_CONPW|nr:uncharacterized protein CONPUDRAFT_169105 [Coniophora puteana RWD-64-598 SS2]EIW75852.1 hypothetical protein CONPUDRAFT_169105 [Coniophora puteana RWD-64-598 SS2]
MPSPAEAMAQAPLLGTLFTMFLYGITCVQAFYYSQNYQDDRMGVKLVVAAVWLLETAHTVLSIYFIEWYLINNFTNEENLFLVNWGIPTSFIVGFTVAFVVNLYFIWRFWRLSRNWVVPVILLMLAVARYAVGLLNSVQSKTLSGKTSEPTILCVFLPAYVLASKSLTGGAFKVFIVVGYVLSVLVDALIAVSLCWLLHSLRTGIKRTENLIDNLIIYTINTGVLTSLGAILVLILFLTLPTSLAFIGALQVQCKLYAISLLASLNSRHSTLSASQPYTSSLMVHNNTFAMSPTRSFSAKRSGGNHVSRIEIHKSVETEHDTGHVLCDNMYFYLATCYQVHVYAARVEVVVFSAVHAVGEGSCMRSNVVALGPTRESEGMSMAVGTPEGRRREAGDASTGCPVGKFWRDVLEID